LHHVFVLTQNSF